MNNYYTGTKQPTYSDTPPDDVVRNSTLVEVVYLRHHFKRVSPPFGHWILRRDEEPEYVSEIHLLVPGYTNSICNQHIPHDTRRTHQQQCEFVYEHVTQQQIDEGDFEMCPICAEKRAVIYGRIRSTNSTHDAHDAYVDSKETT